MNWSKLNSEASSNLLMRTYLNFYGEDRQLTTRIVRTATHREPGPDDWMSHSSYFLSIFNFPTVWLWLNSKWFGAVFYKILKKRLKYIFVAGGKSV